MNRLSRGSFSPDDISDWFWRIIQEAEHDRARLQQLLEQMSRDEIIRFYHEFQEAAVQLMDEPFIVHMDNDSEDALQDVAEWVVSQGKQFYSRVWDNPEQIPARLDEHAALTSFQSVADNVFWRRFSEPIPYEGGSQ